MLRWKWGWRGKLHNTRSVLLPERFSDCRFAPSVPDLTGFSRATSILSPCLKPAAWACYSVGRHMPFSQEPLLPFFSCRLIVSVARTFVNFKSTPPCIQRYLHKCMLPMLVMLINGTFYIFPHIFLNQGPCIPWFWTVKYKLSPCWYCWISF